MKETITELVEKFVQDDENYFVDTYSSYTVVGIENRENLAGFVAALEERGIEYREVDNSEKPVIRVFDTGQ